MDDGSDLQTPRDISHLFVKVIEIGEAINWIAHGNFAGSSFGPRALFEIAGTSESLESRWHEDWGKEQLAFELLWARAEAADIRMFGRKATLDGDEQWSTPANEPEPISP